MALGPAPLDREKIRVGDIVGPFRGVHPGHYQKLDTLGVKVGQRARVPASFFVSISYMCWAYRKGELRRHGEAWLLDDEPLSAPPVRRPGHPLRVAG